MYAARAIGLCLLLAMLPAQAQTPPTQDCRLKRIAALDMDLDDTGRITVPVTLNGAPQRMMVDTGAAETLITRQVVSKLKLETRKQPNGKYMVGFGGAINDKVVDIKEFGLGSMKGKDFTLFVEEDDIGSAGLLGADFLYFFDLDFDFAHAKLNLVSPDHCPGEVVYWTSQPYGVIPFEIKGNWIVLHLKLDGEEMNAILDTGAADTPMSLERASSALDIDRDVLNKHRRHTFKVLSFGEIDVNRPTITLVPDRESELMGRCTVTCLNMIIGMTVLRQLHLYISYKEKKIYVTPATAY